MLYAFGPLFARATELWPDNLPKEFHRFVEIGQGLAHLVHEGAHINGRLPSPQAIREWRATAVESSEGIAIVDPQWFLTYWTGVERRGLPLPLRIAAMVRTIRATGHLAVSAEEGSVSPLYPSAIGWVEAGTGAHEGRYVLDPLGLTFIPSAGDSFHGHTLRCGWSAITAVMVVPAAEVAQPIQAHSRFLKSAGVTVREKVLVAFVQANMPYSRTSILAIFPTSLSTLEKWLEGFGDAGVRIEDLASETDKTPAANAKSSE